MKVHPLSVTRGKWATPLPAGHVHDWRPAHLADGQYGWECDCGHTTTTAPDLAWAASTVVADEYNTETREAA